MRGVDGPGARLLARFPCRFLAICFRDSRWSRVTFDDTGAIASPFGSWSRWQSGSQAVAHRLGTDRTVGGRGVLAGTLQPNHLPASQLPRRARIAETLPPVSAVRSQPRLRFGPGKPGCGLIAGDRPNQIGANRDDALQWRRGIAESGSTPVEGLEDGGRDRSALE